MNQKSMIGIALLVVGVILLYFGYNASESPTGEITEALTGRFDDETMFYFIGGAVAVVIGGVMLFRK
jgi:uncharacterized membrane protein